MSLLGKDPFKDGPLSAWRNCKNCPLGLHAFKHVLGKGEIPCDVFFLGEGPGKAEDILGLPFVGRSGKLLEEALEAAGASKLKCFFTNLVACRPCDGEGRPNRTPEESEIESCRARLIECFREAAPSKAIVFLGRTADMYGAFLLQGSSLVKANFPHPAKICRQGGTKGEEFHRYVQRFRAFFESLKGESDGRQDKVQPEVHGASQVQRVLGFDARRTDPKLHDDVAQL